MPKSPMIQLRHHKQEYSASCLAACVVMVLSYWQVEVSEADIRRIIKTRPWSGAHPINLLRLNELGFETWLSDGTLDDLRQQVDLGRPVIVFLWTGALRYWSAQSGVDYLHAVVVVGWTQTTVSVHDPVLSSGPVDIAWAEFKDAWAYSRQMMATIEPRQTRMD